MMNFEFDNLGMWKCDNHCCPGKLDKALKNGGSCLRLCLSFELPHKKL